MSADNHAPAASGGGSKMTPGTLFGFLFLGGLGLYLFLMFFGMGIDSFGAAKRRYPEIVMGIIAIGFAAGAAAYAIADKKSGGGAH